METQGFACELGETEEPADSTQIQSEHGEDAAELEDDDCFGGALSDVREAEREWDRDSGRALSDVREAERESDWDSGNLM